MRHSLCTSLLFVTLIAPPFLPARLEAATTLTAQQVLALIEQHADGPWKGATVDTIKAGDPNTPVTGIATTFTDTFDVLQRAAKAGANLVISHEPSFYNHLDDPKLVAHDPVHQAKLAFIQDHHMVVFRFHDHWHHPHMKPDGIMEGMIAALGWKQYQVAGNEMLFNVPETSLDALAASVASKLKIRTLRVVGDPAMKVQHLAFLPGAAGAESQIPALGRPEVQVLLVGEAREWETVEYARDAVAEHRPKALIILGHDVSEEAGMDNCAKWLKTFLPISLPVAYIPAGEPFWQPAR